MKMRLSDRTAACQVLATSGSVARDGASEDEPARLRMLADRLIFVGCFLSGTIVLGVVGVPMILYGFLILRRLERAEVPIRSWTITFIGTFILLDATLNFIFWSLDLFPAHDTVIARTLWHGYGYLADGAYYIGYNTTSAGGSAAHGEKAIEAASTLLVFPLRIAASWAFLRMKRWGLQMLVITTWVYVSIWITYAVNVVMDHPNRVGASEFGMIGFWLVNLWFFGPFLVLPYLYTVNREEWAD